MTHVMIDLETYGTNPGCPVLSIGAMVFRHTAEALASYTFYGVAKLRQDEFNLFPEKDTVDWWEEQSEEARAIFNHADAKPLPELLTEFAAWLPEDAFVWGNGAGFDQPILAAAYRAVGITLPWKFYNERCYRTLKALAPNVKMVRKGVHHNALDDAVDQAAHLHDIAEALGLTLV